MKRQARLTIDNLPPRVRALDPGEWSNVFGGECRPDGEPCDDGSQCCNGGCWKDLKTCTSNDW